MVDTNGDGRITKPWNEPSVVGGARFEEDATRSTYDSDPALDTRVAVGAYGIIVNPVDGSVWGAQDSYPGKIVRLVVGDDPPESCIAEVFEVPSERWDVEAGGERGFMPRGPRRRPQRRPLDGAVGARTTSPASTAAGAGR